MRDVAVIGIGQTKVDEHWDKSLRELAGEAALEAKAEAQVAQIESIYVGNMMSGVANQQGQLGSMVADWIGQRFTDAVKIESACSSGSAAFRMAYLAVASGQSDIALAVGVEKMTDSPSGEITGALATAADADWEVDHGLSFVALNALIMNATCTNMVGRESILRNLRSMLTPMPRIILLPVSRNLSRKNNSSNRP